MGRHTRLRALQAEIPDRSKVPIRDPADEPTMTSALRGSHLRSFSKAARAPAWCARTHEPTGAKHQAHLRPSCPRPLRSLVRLSERHDALMYPFAGWVTNTGLRPIDPISRARGGAHRSIDPSCPWFRIR